MNTTSAFFLASFGLIVGALPPRAAQADSVSPILVVPSSKATLQATVDLPKGFHDGNGWRLVEVDKPGNPLAAQSVATIAADGTALPDRRRIFVVIPPGGKSAKPRRFRLESSPPGASAAFAFSDDSPDSLRLVEQNKPVLVYNHGVITDEKVPLKDNRRSRACYIHPLWGLNGELLTDDFPVDHYHHHGVFWAWPHVEIGSSEYANSATGPAKTGSEKHDLWMYKDISQKFVRWLGRDTGPLAAVLGVENGWFVGNRKVMVERVWIQAAKATVSQRAIDLDFTWIPVDRPITLRGAEGKSYGGLTIRFAVRKNDDKSTTITVPAGAAAEDLPETPLPWADLTYKFAGMKQPSGAAMFVARDHPNYPPTWLTRHYGALCIGWPGVNGERFAPGKPIHLRYRIWIHSGAIDVAQLKAAYAGYLAEAETHWE